MDIYEIKKIFDVLNGNPYAGRGIIAGMSPSGQYACAAYFIMGRSANSRNRILKEDGDNLYTEPFDASKVEDPSLIIYAAIRKAGDKLIVTNGDQTDTICAGLKEGKSFSESLVSREFEPDAPNLTPRISALLDLSDGAFKYQMSILKSIDEAGSGCARYYFEYPAQAGLGHFIHTYVTDGDPIPTFQGEPERIAIYDDIDAFTYELWDALDEDNKISLYVRYIDIKTGKTENRLKNKNQ